jgi:glucose/mannose-6-phosphate isomerase
LISFSDLEKFDVSGMHKIYDKWPELAKQAYNSDLDSHDFGYIDNIIFCGMGGSGTIGDLFSAILSKTNVHVGIVKGYTLPKTVDSETLVVIISVSGNTIETLNTIEYAKKLDCKLILFSSGGKIEEIAKKDNLLFIKIPSYLSPRASLMNYIYSILKVIKSSIPISENDISESFDALQALSEKINSKNLSNDNIALELSTWMVNIPIIYYPHGLEAAAIRFKNSIQENTKSHAMVEDVIEACHNNIVAWEKNCNISPILLCGPDDYPKTKERWKIIKKYFLENNIEFKEINSINGNILTKLVYLIYLLDYATIYLAICNGIDPSPVKSIDFIKKNLNS